MCFLDFSFRNTFCVSVGKTLWKSQNVSLNGVFQGKHHLVPAVLYITYPHPEFEEDLINSGHRISHSKMDVLQI